MKRLWFLMAGSVTLALFGWLLPARPAALAGQPSVVEVTIPTAPDFYIQDQVSQNPISEMHPDVAYNPVDDLFMVVFDWDFHGTGARDVMFVRVYPDGAIDPMPLEVAEDAAWDDSNPAVAYNPDDDNYLVVWERRDITGVGQIFGAIVDGTTAGAAFAIQTGNADHLAPDVAYSPVAHRYLVVWEDHGIGWGGPPDIVGASCNGTGVDLQWIHIAPEPLDGTSDQRRPAVAAHGTLPRWLVTWEDSRTAATTGIDVYGQQVAYEGSILSRYGGQVAIGAQTGDAAAPAVAWGAAGPATGEYLTVWAEGNWLFGRRLDANGALLGGVLTVSNHPESAKRDPAVAFATASNAWWVVWADDRDYG